MENTRLVYSTDGGRVAEQKAEPQKSQSKDGIVRIHRETKGRKGKGVSIVHGLGLDAAELKKLCTELKKKCGCGGAVKAGQIEVQTDDRDKLKSLLEQKGFSVKLAGG